MADINPILAAAKSAVTDYSGQIVTARDSQASIALDQANSESNIGLNQAIIDNALNQSKLDEQSAKLAVGSAFKFNIREQGEVITSLAAQQRDAFAQKQQASKDLTANDSVSFMENPLQHILNSFSHNDLVTKYYNAERTEQDAATQLATVNKLTNDIASTQSQFTQAVTEASKVAAANKAVELANVKADSSKIQALGYNVEGLTTAMNAPITQLKLQLEANSDKRAQEQLALAYKNYDLHEQEFQWQKDAKADQKEADQMNLERIQTGLKVMYGSQAPDLTNNPRLARDYIRLLKGGGEPGREAQLAWMRGQSGIAAPSPSSIVADAQKNMNIQFSPASMPIKEIIDSVQQSIKSLPVDQQPKKMDEYYNLIDAGVAKKLADYTKTVTTDTKNPLTVPAISDLVKLPGVANTPFAQKVITPAVSSGVDLNNPDKLFSAGMAAVEAGTISQEQLVDGIHSLYVKGVATNLASREFTKYGIIPTPDMQKYVAPITTAPNAMWGATERIDLTNKEMLKRAVGTYRSKVLSAGILGVE